MNKIIKCVSFKGTWKTDKNNCQCHISPEYEFNNWMKENGSTINLYKIDTLPVKKTELYSNYIIVVYYFEE